MDVLRVAHRRREIDSPVVGNGSSWSEGCRSPDVLVADYFCVWTWKGCCGGPGESFNRDLTDQHCYVLCSRSTLLDLKPVITDYG